MYRIPAFLTVIFLMAGCNSRQENSIEAAEPLTPSNSETEQLETAGQKNSIAWKTSWESAAKKAKAESMNILLLFTNPERCPPCRMMEQQTWPNEQVVKAVNANFVPLMIHTGRSSERALGNELMVRGIPATFIVDTDKNVLAKKVGFVPPEEFLSFLESALSLKDLQKKMEAGPENPDVMLELAEAYVGLDRSQEALALLEKICEKDKNNKKGKKIAALYLMGEVALSGQDTKIAKKKFNEIKTLDPKGKTEYADDTEFQLALMPANEGDFSSATDNLEKFIKNFSKSELRPQAFLYLGMCHIRADNKEAGAKALKRLIKEYPDSDEADYAEQMAQKIK